MKPILLTLIISSTFAACSIRQLAVNSIADAVGSESDLFSSDEDPEFIKDAVPFGLKLYEALLKENPKHRKLLLSAAAGFTQYAYAFVQFESELLRDSDPDRSGELKVRAKKMFLRARGYGVRLLELDHPGFFDRLSEDPAQAVSTLKVADIPAVYWVGASWASAIAVSKDLDLIPGLHIVDKLMNRALELDPDYGNGALHEFFIVFDGSRSEAMGGSHHRARSHFTRAIELTGGLKAGPYVALAENVSVGAQDIKEFRALLNQALAIDIDAAPALRLENILSQRRARWLLARADDLFLISEEELEE